MEIASAGAEKGRISDKICCRAGEKSRRGEGRRRPTRAEVECNSLRAVERL
jgi:hypothetical protein